MTFEQWWNEYCVKHHITVGSTYEVAIKQVALESSKWGYCQGSSNCWDILIQE